MSEPTKAVLLSYASQDSESARRIGEALRGAGIEVWFDQSELRGGDAWDHKIREQVRAWQIGRQARHLLRRRINALGQSREARDMFDYFGILVSIILGLALTHLLHGIAKQILMRRTVRIYWVHLLWTCNVVFVVLALWWGMYWWKGLRDWPAPWFFFLSIYAITLFLWSFLLYPQEFGEHTDFIEHFYAHRKWFFGMLIAAMLLDIPETFGKQWWHLRAVPGQYPYVIGCLLGIGVIGFSTANRKVHAILSVLWLPLMLGYEFFSELRRIVGRS